MWLVDRLTNLVSALGTGKDKSVHSSFVANVLSAQQLNAMHRSDWLARKIVDIIPQDMTREWRDWQAEDGQIEAIEEAEKALGLQAKVGEAMQRARLQGGAGIFIGARDGLASDELMTDRVGKDGISYLHVLSREEVTAGEIVRDVLSPFYGQPAFYEIKTTDGTSARIHPSRMIRFVGAPVLDRNVTASDPWGDSVLQIVYDAVLNAASSQQHIAAMIPEAKLDIIKVPGLSDTLSTDKGTADLIKRFTLANQMKSTINALMLEGDGESGESWQQKQIRFSEFPELMRLFLQIAAGAADIPVTRLLGQSPAGLNATGDADVRNYYDNLRSKQNNELRPTIAPLDEMLIRHALGARPSEVHYRWSPLWQMDEAQRAEVAAKKAATAKTLADSGLVPLDALAAGVQNQLIEDGTYPGLEAALEESAALAGAGGQQQTAEEQDDQGAAPPSGEKQQTAKDAAPRTLYEERRGHHRVGKGAGFRDDAAGQ